jgi:hypothetical protein
LPWRPDSTRLQYCGSLFLRDRPRVDRRRQPYSDDGAAISVQPYLDAIVLMKFASAAAVGWFGAAKHPDD